MIHRCEGRCHYCGNWWTASVAVDTSDGEYHEHVLCSPCFLRALAGEKLEPLPGAPRGWDPRFGPSWWSDKTFSAPPPCARLR